MTYVLALYPDVYHRLYEEVVTVCAEDRLCTVEEIRDMRYRTYLLLPLYCRPTNMYSFHQVRATINETLRLFPPVPFNIRRSTSDPSILPSVLSKLTNGLYMYPKCSITYSLLHIHRRKDLWGDDAEDFKPERWFADESKKVHVSNPFAFIPFNGGPRMVSYFLLGGWLY